MIHSETQLFLDDCSGLVMPSLKEKDGKDGKEGKDDTCLWPNPCVFDQG